MKKTISVLVIALLWPPLPAPAQQEVPSPSALVKFTANSELVVQIVSVKDKNGSPIEGLSARDFLVTENGVPQDVTFCEYQRIADTPVEPLASYTGPRAALREPTPASAVAARVAPAPGGIRYRDRRLIAIYFDISAMPIADRLRAFQAARTFIESKMVSSDLIAVMKFDSGAVTLVQDFTDDRDQLVGVISNLAAGTSGDAGAIAGSESTADSGAAFGQDDAEFNLFNTDRHLAALQTGVKMLGGLYEKKALVYFTSGLNLHGVDNQAQIRATVNSAIRANVSLFPVDARGLVALPPLGDATRGSQGGTAMYTGGTAMAMIAGFQQSQDTLYSLAADTGGKAMVDSNDLSAGMVQAERAISSSYILGYYTSNAALDGKFRKISVSLRDVTAKLDYRQGYFAGKTFNRFGAADKERQLEDALMQGDPITDLTVEMEVNYFQLNRAEYYVPVVLKVPGSELTLARRRGAEHTVIDFIGEIKDESGATVQNIRDKVDIKLTGETAAQLARRPIEYDTGYTLLPGTYDIKVLARDDETGRIGTYINKFVIPNLNFSKEDRRIPISSVVLSSQRVDLRDALYTTGKDKEQTANPLVQGGQKLIPSVTRVFKQSRDLFIYLQAYKPAPEVPQTLLAFVTFYRDQTKTFETSPQPVNEGLNSNRKTVPFRFSLVLDKLDIGRYTCQVTVLDPVNRKAAFWQAPVMLVP